MGVFDRTAWLAATAAAALLFACSDDSGDAGSSGTGGTTPETMTDAATAPAMDAGTDAATAVDSGSTPEPTPTLGADIAGAACSSDDDCAVGGTCATELDLAGTLAAFTSVAAAPTPAPGGTCTLECTSDAECGSGGACIGDSQSGTGTSPGLCQRACSSDGDCRDGYRCVGGTDPDTDAGVANDTPGCAPIPETVSLADDVVGTACSADADCGSGATCQLESEGTRFLPGNVYPGGSCSGPCLADADCGAGGRCLLNEGEQGAGTCMDECSGDGDCRDGYRCRDQGAGFGACVPGDAPVDAAQLGIACTRADDGTSTECDSNCLENLGGLTLSGMGTPAPGGYCSARCVEDADCGGGYCLGAIALTGFAGVQGRCYKSCTDTADCGRDGYECRQYVDRLGSFIGGGDGRTPDVCQQAATSM